MEKNAPAPNPCPCKKISTAVTTNPALRVLLPGSFSSQDPSPANNGESYSTSGVLPVKFDPLSNGDGKSVVPIATLVKPHQGTASTGQGPSQGLHESTAQRKHDSNDPFSDYIRRAKVTIRTLTLAHGGRNAAAATSSADDAYEHENKKENSKDNHFSDFISRAKMKIRTSSNHGRGRSLDSNKSEG